jgi:hypothetical protein
MPSLTFNSAAGEIGAQVADNARQALQAAITATTSLTSLMPAGAEEVSAQAVEAFATEAAQMLALNQAAQEELMRMGQAVAEIARMYSEVDATAAGSLAGAAVGVPFGNPLAGV